VGEMKVTAFATRAHGKYDWFVTWHIDGREVDCGDCDHFPRDGGTLGHWCECYCREPRFCRHLCVKGVLIATYENVAAIRSRLKELTPASEPGERSK